MSRNLFLPLAASCLFVISPAGADETDDVLDDLGERCIDTRRIERTEIIDGENILFHVRGQGIYHNQLRHRCPGLRRHDVLSYKTTTRRLCNTDVVTVLDRMGGTMMRGPSCGLGKFYLISEEEAQALKGAPDIESEPMDPAEAEEPGIEAEPLEPAEPEEPEVSE